MVHSWVNRCSILGLFLALGNLSAAYAPSASTKNGTYLGKTNVHYNQDEFLGIPYAQPPVGDLRFRGPASLNESWSEERNATEYSPIVSRVKWKFNMENQYLLILCSVLAMV